ncbi:hypothetical protein [Nostoc parmelioides]|uniref:Uncharacterized protein n=1 Tax=Nostoc parmelioides FACHB-3921 TaxID=2692909 RepID=A0ABR8B998_9NOSO|nr:hypothetical protein [Nostoc parmelioides]MBD2250064.1 hypothetical protein [Nostoc parmelioides FACHB-3921]
MTDLKTLYCQRLILACCPNLSGYGYKLGQIDAKRLPYGAIRGLVASVFDTLRERREDCDCLTFNRQQLYLRTYP